MTLAIAATSLGKETPIVLLVVDGNGGALVPRLTAELEGLGFAVIRGTSTSGSLATQAKARGAQAAVRVPRSRRALSVWVTDPERTRDTARETEITGVGVGDDVFTVRSVELLRAAFLEIDVAMPVAPSKSDAPAASSAPLVAPSSSPSASPPPPPAPPASTAEAAPPPPPPPSPPPSPVRASSRHGLTVGGVWSQTPGGLPAQGHLALGAEKRWGSAWGVSAWLTTPGIGPALGSSEGEADVRSMYGGFEVLRVGGRAPLALVLGAGPGVVWLRASGRASSSAFAGRVDDVVLPWLYARVGGRYAATTRVSVTADARIGATWTPTHVVFAGREIATYGRPIALPGIGMEVALD